MAKIPLFFFLKVSSISKHSESLSKRNYSYAACVVEKDGNAIYDTNVCRNEWHVHSSISMLTKLELTKNINCILVKSDRITFSITGASCQSIQQIPIELICESLMVFETTVKCIQHFSQQEC